MFLPLGNSNTSLNFFLIKRFQRFNDNFSFNFMKFEKSFFNKYINYKEIERKNFVIGRRVHLNKRKQICFENEMEI